VQTDAANAEGRIATGADMTRPSREREGRLQDQSGAQSEPWTRGSGVRPKVIAQSLDHEVAILGNGAGPLRTHAGYTGWGADAAITEEALDRAQRSRLTIFAPSRDQMRITLHAIDELQRCGYAGTILVTVPNDLLFAGPGTFYAEVHRRGVSMALPQSCFDATTAADVGRDTLLPELPVSCGRLIKLDPSGEVQLISRERDDALLIQCLLAEFKWNVTVLTSLEEFERVDMVDPSRLEAAVFVLPLPAGLPSLAESSAKFVDLNPCCALAVIVKYGAVENQDLAGIERVFGWPTQVETLHLQLANAVRNARERKHVLASGAIRLQVPTAQLRGPGRTKRLSGQPFSLLSRLLRAKDGSVVVCGPEATPGMRMGEEALSKAVQRLRAIVGETCGPDAAARIRFCGDRVVLDPPHEKADV
jgi:hypothetical protein